MGGIEGNKKVAREYIQQVFNEHRPERSIEFVTPDVVWHGDLLGVPARGKQIRWDAIETYRIRDGWISEEWAANDMAAICHQLGAFDPPWLN